MIFDELGDRAKSSPENSFIDFKYKIEDEPRKGDRCWDIHDVSKFKKDYPEWEYKYSLENIIKDLCQ